jgi:FkbM family methyltransferase
MQTQALPPNAPAMAHDEFVFSAYRLLLGRDPDPEGLTTALQSLGNGMRREDYLLSILVSPEFREKVGPVEQYPDLDLIVPTDGNMRICIPASDRLIMPTLVRNRSWEPHISAYLRANLKPDQVFVDAGANIGYFTALAAPLVREVIAFEPVPETADYLDLNIALNGLRNVRVFRVGLWHENTTLSMSVDPFGLSGATISQDANRQIQCVTLDSLNLGAVHWVKMDVEGVEPMALAGMARTVERYRPTFIVEVNPPSLAAHGKSPRDIWEYFCTRGYHLRAFEHWQTTEPQPVTSLEHLGELCVPGGLIDVLALPS